MSGDNSERKQKRPRTISDELIGKGQFSNVYKDIVGNNTVIARKEYKPHYKEYGEKEVKILEYLESCPHIINVLGYINLGNYYSVLLPLYTFNLLVYTHDFLDEGTKILHSNLKIVTISLLSGVSFMNQKGITNTDIKSENILVNVLQDGSLNVVISDFSSYIIWKKEKGAYLNYYNITTLWYRSILTIAEAKKKDMMNIEMWMLACIIYETYYKIPLFEVTYVSEDTLKEQNEKLLEKIFQQLGFPSDEFIGKYFPTDKERYKKQFGKYKGMNSTLKDELNIMSSYGNFIMDCLDYSQLNSIKAEDWLKSIKYAK